MEQRNTREAGKLPMHAMEEGPRTRQPWHLAVWSATAWRMVVRDEQQKSLFYAVGSKHL